MSTGVEMKKPQVKICGITRIEDALGCVAAGVDAVGFMFYPQSPRYVSVPQARDMIRHLPTRMAKVGVFVDASYDEVLEKVAGCGLSAVQLHGQEPPELVEQLLKENLLVIKALFAERAPGFDTAPGYAPSAFLVECGKGVLPGGNALQWDWAKAQSVPGNPPLILAGGLSPENVARAVAQARPDAVDVSSGVELSPGIKDLDKIKKFIHSLPTSPVKCRIF